MDILVGFLGLIMFIYFIIRLINSIFKPQKYNTDRKTAVKKTLGLWLISFIVLMILVSITTPDEKVENKNANIQNSSEEIDNTTVASQPKPVDKQEVAKPSNWWYDAEVDKMRGTKSYFAGVKSLNSANFDFPYQGKSHLNIQVRNKNSKNEVIFIIDKGQFDCGFDGCQIAVKFDNGSVQKYRVSNADNGVSTVLFLSNNSNGFIKKLKSSKSVMIEANFYQEGAEQFEFNIEGLEWKF